MARLTKVVGAIANLAFHAFLAAYWYLVHALFLEYAVAGALLAYILFRALRDRIALGLPEPALLVLAALLFFLMLNPLPALRGMSLAIWCVLSAVGFRICFANLTGAGSKAGAMLVSYLLFLALPLGLPRIGATAPSAVAGQPLDVLVVGAGFGGIAMGKELLDAGVTNFRVYEAAEEVGGTWWHNRYPGLHVDVQSALYSFSFYPNPNWSRRWAPRAELHAYSVAAADELGVRPFIEFNTWVESVRFDESSQLWSIQAGDRSVQAHHLVLATGGLHIPNTPDFTGADSFRGTTFHSARWPEDVDLNAQRIAIIGSGASAVQILPELAKVARQVDMYQRTPNWISSQDNRQVSALRQFIYAYVPMAYRLQRLRTHVMSELGFRITFGLDSTFRPRIEAALTDYVKNTVRDADLAEKLIPDYEFGCKRPLVTGHFYPSLNRDNVNVITEGIERVTPDGILSREGVERDYDMIIAATGYRVAELPFPIAGRNGAQLAELWQEKPEAYESMMVHGFPNLYLMSGPNSGVIGSIIIHIETVAGYAMQAIEHAGNSRLVEPKLEAQRAYNLQLQAGLKNTVWAGSCKSWYKLEDGHVIANHPDPISRIVYERSRPRWNDFIVSERRDN